MTSIFDGVEAAQVRRGNQYEKAGEYVQRVDAIKLGVSRKGQDFLAIEKTILHVYDDDNGEGHRGGESVTHMLMANWDSFLPTVKSFVAATLGCEPESVTKEACLQICDESQPLSGRIVHVNNTTVQTRDGRDFTRIFYLGQVEASRLKTLLSPEEIQRFFPDGKLDLMIEAAAKVK